MDRQFCVDIGPKGQPCSFDYGHRGMCKAINYRGEVLDQWFRPELLPPKDHPLRHIVLEMEGE